LYLYVTALPPKGECGDGKRGREIRELANLENEKIGWCEGLRE